MNDAELCAALASVVGKPGLVTDADVMAPLLTDWRGRYQGSAVALVRPASTEEVVAVVKLAAAAKRTIVPQGGNTGLVGGATPDGSGRQILLSLARMDRIRAVDHLDNTITAEAGCVLARLQDAAEDANRLFPLSLGSEGTCQLGGVLSTNAGGMAVLRYGTMRDLTLGLEVVLPNGEVFSALRGLRKDNTGYDLKQLFIGAEGTLGIITAATVKLFPRPRERVTALVALPDLTAAVALLRRLQEECGDSVTTFEVFADLCLDLLLQFVPGHRAPFAERAPFYALVEVGTFYRGFDARALVEGVLVSAVELGVALDATVAADDAQAQAFWRMREEIPEAERRSATAVKHDISVPVSRVPAFVAESERMLAKEVPGSTIIVFGHLGDGSLHYNVVPPGSGPRMPIAPELATRIFQRVHDLVVAHGGSISAEHGIGQLKRDELWRLRSGVDRKVMLAVKQAIDPQGLMNPGRVL